MRQQYFCCNLIVHVPCKIRSEYSGYFEKISRNMTENISRNFQNLPIFFSGKFQTILECQWNMPIRVESARICQLIPEITKQDKIRFFPAYYKKQISRIFQKILSCSLKVAVIQIMYQFPAFSSIFQILKIFSAFIPGFSGVYFMMIHSD